MSDSQFFRKSNTVVKERRDFVVVERKNERHVVTVGQAGPLQKLTPIYEELAEKLAGEKDIVIAKMDATANDHPSQYQVQGFPTIYFSRKGQKASPVQYQGGREVDDFIKYLAREATEELAGWKRDGTAKKKSKKEL